MIPLKHIDEFFSWPKFAALHRFCTQIFPFDRLEEHYSACESSFIISSVALEGALKEVGI